MGKLFTEIDFEFIGRDKQVPKMSVDTTNMEMIWKAVEDELASRGFVRHNLHYNWLVNGNDICVAKILSTGGIISQFRLRTRVDNRYGD